MPFCAKSFAFKIFLKSNLSEIQCNFLVHFLFMIVICSCSIYCYCVWSSIVIPVYDTVVTYRVLMSNESWHFAEEPIRHIYEYIMLYHIRIIINLFTL